MHDIIICLSINVCFRVLAQDLQAMNCLNAAIMQSESKSNSVVGGSRTRSRSGTVSVGMRSRNASIASDADMEIDAVGNALVENDVDMNSEPRNGGTISSRNVSLADSPDPLITVGAEEYIQSGEENI